MRLRAWIRSVSLFLLDTAGAAQARLWRVTRKTPTTHRRRKLNDQRRIQQNETRTRKAYYSLSFTYANPNPNSYYYFSASTSPCSRRRFKCTKSFSTGCRSIRRLNTTRTFESSSSTTKTWAYAPRTPKRSSAASSSQFQRTRTSCVSPVRRTLTNTLKIKRNFLPTTILK